MYKIVRKKLITHEKRKRDTGIGLTVQIEVIHFYITWL